MKKSRATGMAVILALLLSGCGKQAKAGEWNSGAESIYINRAMGIESSVIYTSPVDNDTYNQDELKAYVEEIVVSYNEENGGANESENREDADKLPVALKSCTLDGTTGKLIFEYRDGDNFVSFARETGDKSHTLTGLSVQTVGDALAAGKLLDGSFLTADGQAAASEEVTGQSDQIAVSTAGSAVICTEGEILYVTNGVTLRDSHTAVVPDGENYVIFQK